jgi:hypothetical protein
MEISFDIAQAAFSESHIFEDSVLLSLFSAFLAF